jgi:hypothetical protein
MKIRLWNRIIYSIYRKNANYFSKVWKIRLVGLVHSPKEYFSIDFSLNGIYGIMNDEIITNTF